MARYNTRRIKRGRNYSSHEVCELMVISRGTLRQWRKEGLKVIKERNPQLYQGGDTADFLDAKQKKQKHKCKPNELFCCRCHKPRPSIGDMVDIIFQAGNRIKLIGICAECGIPTHRVASIKKLPEIQKTFVLPTTLPIRLFDNADTAVNHDFRKESTT